MWMQFADCNHQLVCLSARCLIIACRPPASNNCLCLRAQDEEGEIPISALVLCPSHTADIMTDCPAIVFFVPIFLSFCSFDRDQQIDLF